MTACSRRCHKIYILVCCHALFDLQLFISRAGINSCLEDVKTAQKARERQFWQMCNVGEYLFSHKKVQRNKISCSRLCYLFSNDQEVVYPNTINSAAASRESLSHKAPVTATQIASKDGMMQGELEEESSQLMLDCKPCLHC